MNATRSSITFPSDLEVESVRVFQAPRLLVWRACTESVHMKHWWGLRQNRLRIDAMDVRVGGRWRYVEVAPDGQEHAFNGVYQDVTPIERLVYTFEYEPMAGHVVIDTITLQDLGAQTLMRTNSRYASKEDRDGMVASGMEGGALESWARLEERLETIKAENDEVMGDAEDISLVMERSFKAPRDLVFAACTEPEHLMHWWGPKGYEMKVAQMDLRAGGTYLYGLSAPQGGEMWGKFVYSAVLPPERLDYINSFCEPDGTTMRHPLAQTWPLELYNTWRFSESDGMTTIHMHAVPINASAEERATFAQARSGVTGGTNASLDQLESYLASIQ